MTNKTWWTWLSGAAFLVVLIVGFLIAGDTPNSSNDSVREILNYYDDDTTLYIAVGVEVLAAALLVYFGSHMRRALIDAELLAPVVFAGTIIVAAGAAVDASVTLALVDIADEGDQAIAPGAVQALAIFFDNDFVPIALGAIIFMSATGLAVIRHGALPKWLGWVALVFVVVSFTPVGFVGVIGTALWIFGVSIYMALRAKKA